jgi:hypothetical protein
MNGGDPLTVADPWRSFSVALERLRDANVQVSFWLRDDDATEPTQRLERLVRLCGTHAIPLLLAIVPQPATVALAQMLATQPLVHPCQHGYAHINHAPDGQRAQELGFRPAPIICDELSAGRQKLQQLFGDRLNTILVPPWNRYDPLIVPNLVALGFEAISGFGRADQNPDQAIIHLNTHVDIIDWRKKRRTKPLSDLIAILIAELELARNSNGQVAILTHHLVHDEAAWAFLEDLFGHTRSHPAVCWRGANEFLAGHRSLKPMLTTARSPD